MTGVSLFIAGKKILKKFGGLLSELACMKVTLSNFFCIELYANFGGSFMTFWGLIAPSPRVFFLAGLLNNSRREHRMQLPSLSSIISNKRTALKLQAFQGLMTFC